MWTLSSKDAERIAMAIAPLAIISNAYLGLNGEHVWRQADSYSQILGFLRRDGLTPLSTFAGPPTMFDVPIYQAFVAGVSAVTFAEPLVAVRFVNAGLWLVLVLAGWQMVGQIRPAARLWFATLLTASPLFIHFYSVPLPDCLSLSLGALGVALVQRGRWWLGGALLFVAALIKSPIVFVLLIFAVLWSVLVLKRRIWRPFAVLAVALACAALAAEGLRRLTTPPSADNAIAFSLTWYFGRLRDRIDPNLWVMSGGRLLGAFASPWLAVVLLAAATIALLATGRVMMLAVGVLPLIGGWLVFANVYRYHDYYQLPGMWCLFLALAVGLDLATSRLPWAAWLALAVALLSLIYGAHLGRAQSAGFEEASRYAVAGVEGKVLYVQSDFDDGPTMGGLLGRAIEKVGRAEFETECDRLTRDYGAIVGPASSACLAAKAGEASMVIRSADLITWVQGGKK